MPGEGGESDAHGLIPGDLCMCRVSIDRFLWHLDHRVIEAQSWKDPRAPLSSWLSRCPIDVPGNGTAKTLLPSGSMFWGQLGSLLVL